MRMKSSKTYKNKKNSVTKSSTLVMYVMLACVLCFTVLIFKTNSTTSVDIENITRAPSIPTMTMSSVTNEINNSSNNSTQSNSNITADGANKYLYDLCEQYFNVEINGERFPIIYPLAVANVETGEWADHDKTWSSLYPSRYAPMDKIETFNVMDAITIPACANNILQPGRSFHGTLQMSNVFGTGDPATNAKMSGSEKSKAGGSAKPWMSDKPGDRFYMPDELLRLQYDVTTNLKTIKNQNLQYDNQYALIAMLSICHNSGNGILVMGLNGPFYYWGSRAKFVAWSNICGSDAVINALKQEYASSKAFTLDRAKARALMTRLGHNYTSYIGRDQYQGEKAMYPVQTLYAYIVLEELYHK